MESIEIFNGEYILFCPMDVNYGLAGFTICPVYSRGNLVEVHIEPRQRPEVRYRFVVKGNFESLYIDSWVGVDQCRMWTFPWCSVHQTVALLLTAPRNADRLEISKLSVLTLNFGSATDNTGGKNVMERLSHA